jgi:fructokinase
MTVVCLGELLIDFVANESGVTVGQASGFQKKPGGAPANVAVAVKRLGVPSAFMTQVGNDPFGHYLAGVLSAEGVNIEAITYSAQARTPLAFVSLAANGERSFMFYRNPSADMLMTPADLKLHVLEGAKVFHFGSITLIGEPSKSATLAAVEAAQARGITISYDPNLRLPLWESAEAARAGMLVGLDYAQLVKISEEELEFLGGDVRALFREPTQIIFVTAGEHGVTAYTRSDSVQVAGFPVNAVDTTGAGDSFMAAVLVGVVNGEDLQDTAVLAARLRIANAVGAITTTGYGAIPSLPTMPEVEAFLATQ